MADVEVLPLPDWGGAQIIPDNLIRDYARANMEPLIAEIETLRAEVRRLNFEVDAAAIYGDDRDAHYLQAETRAERLAEALRDTREYVTAALQAQREAFAGHEDCSDIPGIEADLHKICLLYTSPSPRD